MKIIFLTQSFDPEPAALRGLPLGKWMVRRGHEVKVLTTFPNYPGGRIYPGYKMRLWQREVIDGIPVLRVPLYPSHDNSALRRVLTFSSFAATAATLGALLIGSADLIYVWDHPHMGLAGLVLKTFRRTRWVHDIGDMWPETVIESGMIRGSLFTSLVGASISAWCRFMYRCADSIVVLSPGFKRLLIERGVPESKVHVIYNWTDENIFKPLPRDEALAQELGFAGYFNILYAGNLGVMQGLEAVIKAAARIKDMSRVRVWLMGTGPKEDELKVLAASLGADNVQFIGRRQFWEMPKIYALADALLVSLKNIPFLHATIPSKTQVALASGRPILMAVRGDAAEIVSRARAGVVCEPENEQQIAEAMTQLSKIDPSALEEMGRMGRKYYLEQLSLEIGGERMERIFLNTLKGRRPGPV